MVGLKKKKKKKKSDKLLTFPIVYNYREERCSTNGEAYPLIPNGYLFLSLPKQSFLYFSTIAVYSTYVEFHRFPMTA